MIFKRVNENSNRYRRLNRALFGDETGKIRTFAIISGQNPFGKKASNEENSNSDKDFKRALAVGRFVYTPLKGHYGNSEKSYIIFNLALNDAKTLARNYKQESFFFGKASTDGSTIGYFITHNNGDTYEEVEQSRTITYENEAEDFFSKFGFKFRINMREFGDIVPEITDPVNFEESLNEDRTFMSRARYRNKYSREDK